MSLFARFEWIEVHKLSGALKQEVLICSLLAEVLLVHDTTKTVLGNAILTCCPWEVMVSPVRSHEIRIKNLEIHFRGPDQSSRRF